jgi:hypothetical protein
LGLGDEFFAKFRLNPIYAIGFDEGKEYCVNWSRLFLTRRFSICYQILQKADLQILYRFSISNADSGLNIELGMMGDFETMNSFRS